MESAYAKGFLPGPEETEKEFFDRIAATEHIIKDPKKYITDRYFSKTELSPCGGAALLAKRKNFFLHASSTIIVELKDKLIIPIITSPSSRLVDNNEVMKHELVHAKRALFTEPKFEEMIAFRTSKHKWRKYLSPILSSNIELLLFFSCALLSFFSLFPLTICLSLFAMQLYRRQKIIRRCLSYLKQHTKHPEEVLVGMLDSEIIAMSKGRLEEINFSLFRWKFMQTLFGKVK